MLSLCALLCRAARLAPCGELDSRIGFEAPGVCHAVTLPSSAGDEVEGVGGRQVGTRWQEFSSTEQQQLATMAFDMLTKGRCSAQKHVSHTRVVAA